VKSDRSTVESRRNRLLELLSEGKSEAQAAEVLRAEGYPASHDTIGRDVDALVPKWRAENASAFEQYRENQFARITAKWAEIESDASMSGAEKHAAWARWMRLEMDLLGTNAPSRSIQAHVSSSAQLDPLYLDVRSVLQSLEEADQQAGLELLRDFARSRVRPLTIDLTPKQLTE
jgi:hypothetical protein